MLERSQPKSKQQAIVELVHQLASGRALYDRPIHNQTDLSSANLARATWAVRTKKMLHALLGDYGGIGQFSQSRGNHELGLNPTLHQEIDHFRSAVRDQLVFLEKVIHLLQRMA